MCFHGQSSNTMKKKSMLLPWLFMVEKKVKIDTMIEHVRTWLAMVEKRIKNTSLVHHNRPG